MKNDAYYDGGCPHCGSQGFLLSGETEKVDIETRTFVLQRNKEDPMNDIMCDFVFDKTLDTLQPYIYFRRGTVKACVPCGVSFKEVSKKEPSLIDKTIDLMIEYIRSQPHVIGSLGDVNDFYLPYLTGEESKD